MRARGLILFFVLVNWPCAAAPVDAKAINEAQWNQKPSSHGGISPAMVKMQIMLDRLHFSPGEIDGKPGENVKKAVDAFGKARGLSSTPSQEVWHRLSEEFKEPAIVEYQISEDDVAGPFVEKVPSKLEEQKDLPALGFTSAREKLGEKFHVSPDLLVALNSGKQLDKAGETIFVPNVSGDALPEKAARLEIDKTKQTLTVFGESGALLAVFPVTAGSTEKPAPDGTLKVTSVSKHPTYRYNPNYAFKEVKSQKPFTIKPGPNNPVGLAWIGLNKEGYGIHGTPEPSKIGKSESHGCIRLTNWDAIQLAETVGKGIPVEFGGDESERGKARAEAKGERRKRARR